MNEVKVALASQLLEQRQLGQLLKSWQVGQVLQARVLDTQANGRLLLGVGGHQLVATSEVPVPRGTALSLQVNSLFPLPTLKVQNFPLHSPVPQNPEQQRLQQLLPRQGSVSAPLLTLFDPAAKVNILSVLGVKTDILERLNKSFSQLGLLTDLKSLQQSVAQSGLFLEAGLARSLNSSVPVDQQDLKATLLRLLQQLQDVTVRLPPGALPPAEEAALLSLRSQLEGALAAITLNQLAVTSPESRPGGLWLFDMPFLVRNGLRDLALMIEKRDEDTTGADPERAEWRAVVSVSLPQLGPIEAELFFLGRRVSVALYAQLAEGAAALQARLSVLEAGLAQCGLDVSVVRVHQGSLRGGEASARWQPGVDVTV